MWTPGVALTVNGNTMLRQKVVSKADLDSFISEHGCSQALGFCAQDGGYPDQMQVTFSRYGTGDLYCQIDNRYPSPLNVKPSCCIIMV